MTNHVDEAGMIPFRLPMDIEYLVIDQLADDKHSLASCSLVCSAWLNTSRTNLFRTIIIQSPVHEDNHFSDFLLFLQGRDEGSSGPLTLIANSVREFKIRGFSLSALTEFPMNLLHAYLAVLPKLEHLSLSQLCLVDHSAAFPDQHLTVRPLKTLTIKYCESKPYDDPRHVFEVMQLFSSIGFLTVDGTWKAPLPVGLTSRLRSGPRVSGLKCSLGAPAATALFDQLRSSRSLTRLAHVVVRLDEDCNTTVTPAFLDEAGPNIRHLELNMDYSFDINGVIEEVPSIRMCTCTKLQSLTLWVYCMHDYLYHYDRTLVNWFGSFFRAHRQLLDRDVPSLSALHEIEFKIYPGGQVALDIFPRVTELAEDWEEMESTLMKLPSLEFVKYAFLPGWVQLPQEDEEMIAGCTRERLPSICASRRVEVVFHSKTVSDATYNIGITREI
ncbi:hypothetical protein K466DRAFT_649069 [Polyporus arcularius HHB13444]|uniref:F-box domain-containing protein n=1 Tax=Polyporus arcularius HHB13444 TaxID=1314778 RepID=A0A5C3Q3B1_9APHY|nr:hypothetical protein K466DRAFT_649069 [Polyporus arcularius HHB13444]